MKFEQSQTQVAILSIVRDLIFRWWLAISRDPITVTEIIFGWWTALWGALLFGAWDSFGTAGWAIIRATHIPENAYGAWFVLWGILQAVEVPRRRGRIAVALVLMVSWGLIALALIWVNPATTGTAIYPVFALVEVYIFLRLASRPAQAAP